MASFRVRRAVEASVFAQLLLALFPAAAAAAWGDESWGEMVWGSPALLLPSLSPEGLAVLGLFVAIAFPAVRAWQRRRPGA